MIDIPILELIPQRPPFVMVDKLLSCQDTIATTEFEITPNNVLLDENGTLLASGIIENMAQTCAARIGYINKYLESKTVKIGVVASVKNLEINAYPKTGDVLTTTVEETLGGIFNMTLLTAKTECNGHLIAQGEVKVALTDKESIEQ